MARSLWKGNIAFGLVSIPIEMQTAVREKKVRFHLVTPDGKCRLRQKLYCPDTGKEYDFSQTARGFEVAPGEMVVVDDEELDRLKPESGHVIEVTEFVSLREVDPLYFRSSYILAPSTRAERAYGLLRQAIERSGQVGIGRVVMREKEHIGIVRSYGEALMFTTLYFDDEVVKSKEIELPEIPKAGKSELALARKLIDEMATKFKASQYRDRYREDVTEFLEKKARKKTVTLPHHEAKRQPPKVINLMDRLKKSLRESEGSEKKKGGPAVRRKKAASS